jgi:hypothetical protein
VKFFFFTLTLIFILYDGHNLLTLIIFGLPLYYHPADLPTCSIQIWFQNRRAKVKNMAKRAAILQEEAMRAQFMAASGYMPFYPPAYPSRQAHHYRPPVLPQHFRRARSSSDVMGAVRERARMRAHSVGGGLLNQMQNDMMPPPTATPWSSHFSPYHQQQPHYQPPPQPSGPEIDIADRHVMLGTHVCF